jgi:hypothetical protein
LADPPKYFDCSTCFFGFLPTFAKLPGRAQRVFTLNHFVMKLWRDFKLLALGAGLVLLDGGCQPKDDQLELDDDLAGFFATLVAIEPSYGKFGSVVFAISGTFNNRPLWERVPPNDRTRTVPGQYRGRTYEHLVRIEFQTETVPNSDRDSYLKAGVGACVQMHPRRGELPPLPCANDNIPVYAPAGGVLWPDATRCAGVADPR